ncbi:MAG TPA: DUF4430 domain-containing protein [Acholeplasmataceae bacterium]|nr:DUF4430 domain-containing protein [Acholeplasmataceae bacterium]
MKKRFLFVSFLFTLALMLVGCGKTVPTIAINEVTSTKNSISFVVNVEDSDKVGEIKGIELYLEKEKVSELNDFSELIFNNLLSNTEYKIKAIYEYDLGKKIENVIAEKKIKTLGKSIPTFKFADVIATDNVISFDLDIVDEDNVSKVKNVELYSGEELISTIKNLNIKEFTDLDYTKDYVLKLNYSYDLNDGMGDVENIVASSNIVMQNPTFTVEVINIDGTSLFTGIIVKDKEFNLVDTLINHPEIKLNGSDSDYGFFMTGVCGIEANGDLFQFWSLKVNGVDSMVGISEVEVKKADTISFVLTTWQ